MSTLKKKQLATSGIIPLVTTAIFFLAQTIANDLKHKKDF